MPAWARKYHAKLVLAVLFFIHLGKRVVFFWKPGPGLRQFLANYSQDAIMPVAPLEREHFASYQRCQACSLCTFTCTAIAEGKAPAGFEPKMIMLGLGRSAHEAEYFLEEWLPCVECGSCTVYCPNQVPVHGMATQIIERRSRLGFRR